MLLWQPPTEEGGVGEPVMLYREPDGHLPRVHLVQSLFGPSMSETLTPTSWSQTGVLGATMTSRGLQMAWISLSTAYTPGLSAFYPWNGRLWGRSPSGVVTEWTPGPARMPMERQGDWVRLHELPGQWMGALLMTATETPRAYTLHSLRYCAP